MNYFVTAIGTDSGKTLVSAILCKALHADYWKPVQAGLPGDTETVTALLEDSGSKIHPETFVFKTPASPHAAAALENIKIRLEDFKLPNHTNDLVIEGAGGCLVPLNDSDFVIDLAEKFKAQVILVSNLYLGSINHTLMTHEVLKLRQLPVKGIIFNGSHNSESERIILHHTGLRCLLHIGEEPVINKKVIEKYSRILMEHWHG
jgi:dethiobiotin synthetase